MGLRYPFDQTMEPQAAQVIRHLASRVLIGGASEELCDGSADIPMAEAGRTEGKQTQGLHEREDPAIAEAEAGGALGVDDDWLRDGVEEVVPEKRVVAQIFDV